MQRVCRGRRGVGLVDLLVVVALIPLLTIAFVACSSRQRHSENRVACAGNLRQIGAAIRIYADLNAGMFPRTTYVGGQIVRPVWDTNGPNPNDVSAALFLLLQTQQATPGCFICPSCAYDNRTQHNSGEPATWSNWRGIKRHLSYSYANPYPDDAARKAGYKLATGLCDDFPLAADLNPGTANNPNVLNVSIRSPAPDIRSANSRNHYQNGQNVLYADGHVSFEPTPFCGIRQDNIYTRRATDGSSSAIVDSPLDADDSVLLPCEE
jgi:prepilin-type processing-associated H-X9-DG protein